MADMQLFNDQCLWQISRTGHVVRAVRHRGTIRLPDGTSRPAEPWAVTVMDGQRPIVVMALQPVMERAARTSTLPADELTVGGAMHELTHTLGLPDVAARIERLPGRIRVFDTSHIQRRYGGVRAFAASMGREMALLERAIANPDRCAGARTARRALALTRARRSRFYRGQRIFDSKLEDMFLWLEGVADLVQLAYQRVRHPDTGLPVLVRRLGGARPVWSQHLGLLVLLALRQQGALERPPGREISLAPVHVLERVVRARLRACDG